ncbi:c(7)-type cytochrome triheme domain-containing protein [Noviherbaspirillum sp.]|uniref:c(7)-type cytochrome triheme domain-containing protein n=1 Tax=Noviherbaspirillum sp. TaxID=1926288 RepID=UPI002B4814E7|nr:c(7)-type cytochrome triheme domain-containing protein [Noviherbaspirillum sp.]HJV81300.1 c(7)-type cytochrome triheme domain-containing protein [Noviherbaspirillum sp.]
MPTLRTHRTMWLRLLLAVVFACAGSMVLGQHLPLAKDGVHDPAGPGIKLLQQPNDILPKLPQDVVGNNVRWVKALEEGAIAPRTNILPETQIRVLDLNVLLPRTAEMPMVLFPHKQHTEWLDCSNCHEAIFPYKAGATKGLNMFAVLQGEFCGRCHGAVAFPLTECKRCHSVYRK